MWSLASFALKYLESEWRDDAHNMEEIQTGPKMGMQRRGHQVLWMEWGGRREEGSGWGTHVYLWRIHFDIWQN